MASRGGPSGGPSGGSQRRPGAAAQAASERRPERRPGGVPSGVPSGVRAAAPGGPTERRPAGVHSGVRALPHRLQGALIDGHVSALTSAIPVNMSACPVSPASRSHAGAWTAPASRAPSTTAVPPAQGCRPNQRDGMYWRSSGADRRAAHRSMSGGTCRRSGSHRRGDQTTPSPARKRDGLHDAHTFARRWGSGFRVRRWRLSRSRVWVVTRSPLVLR